MNLPIEIVTLVAANLDNESLEKLSQTRTWPDIALAIRAHNYWHLRVERLVRKTLIYRDGNWQRAYQQLVLIFSNQVPDASSVELFKDVFKLQHANLTLNILLDTTELRDEEVRQVMIACAQHHREYLPTLLDHERVGRDPYTIEMTMMFGLFCVTTGAISESDLALISSRLSEESRAAIIQGFKKLARSMD